MDIIVKKYFTKFLREHQITGNDESTNFEKFINHCVLSTQNISNLEISAVGTGSGNDCSTDGLAIAINNRFVSNLTELTDIINYGMEMEVKLFFIQTKMSAGFDGSEMLNFGAGVIDIFKPEGKNTLVRNEKINEKSKMIQLILENFDTLKEQPKCFLYYVTIGKWIDDQNLIGYVNKVKDDLKSMDLFNEVEFYPCDKDHVRKLYEVSKQQNSAEFKMQSKLEIPYTEGIQEGYLALMPVKDIVNLISESESLKKGIFDSNVRDFQGITNNRVNQEINTTINSGENNRFGLLNNGITIVGKSLSRGQGKYTIKNFQVVNGCQTSNILFENRHKLNDDMWVSVKIVITENDDITNDIVKATNNQTEVEEIQLQAMTEYQHLLESFYNTYSFQDEKLYYERRLGQYNSRTEIEHSRVISFEDQIKSFAAVFLNSPHRSSRFYKTIIEEIEKKIFIKGHEPIIYFTSAYLHYRLEDEFNNDRIEHKYKKYKYHIMMLMKLILCKEIKMPQWNSASMISYCEHILLAVHNDLNIILQEAIDIINKVINDVENLENNKLTHIVNQLILYNDMKLTQQDLQNYKAFNLEIDPYISTFKNIMDEGDMRYRMNKWIEDLRWILQIHGFHEEIEELEATIKILNEECRESRKQVSEVIFHKITNLKQDCMKKIDKSQRYTNIVTE